MPEQPGTPDFPDGESRQGKSKRPGSFMIGVPKPADDNPPPQDTGYQSTFKDPEQLETIQAREEQLAQHIKKKKSFDISDIHEIFRVVRFFAERGLVSQIVVMRWARYLQERHDRFALYELVSERIGQSKTTYSRKEIKELATHLYAMNIPQERTSR